MMEGKFSQSAHDEYAALLHAVRSGIAAGMAFDSGPKSETSPKHLRTGVNSALVSNAALVELLVSKGIFTMAEYQEALVAGMRREVAAYEAKLSKLTGKTITLL